MARRPTLKLLLRLCITVVCVSFMSLYFVLWRQDGPAVTTSIPRPAELVLEVPQSLARLQLQPALNSKRNSHQDESREKKHGKPKPIVLTLVVCGERFNESLVVMKSAVTFTTRTPLYIIIIAEDNLKPLFEKEYQQWPLEFRNRVSISIRPISFPQDGTADEWKNLFKLCASQRLFIPSLLKDIDVTLYVDTDVVFLRPLDEIWDFFNVMNSSHLAAMTPEHEDYATGWYNRFAQHPYFKPLGVNSGVMLMNLTRMRAFHWESHLSPIYHKYKQKITWGDQDILNVLFHHHPDKLYVYPCEWNFRTDHCMYTSVCKSAEKHGVAIVHGNRGVFHSNKQPTFRALYDTFQKYKLGENVKTHLLEPLRKNLQQTAHTNCGKIYPMFLKYLETFSKIMD